MLPLILCYTCGEEISIHWIPLREYIFEKRINPFSLKPEEETLREFFEKDEIDLPNICCRRSLVMTMDTQQAII